MDKKPKRLDRGLIVFWSIAGTFLTAMLPILSSTAIDSWVSVARAKVIGKDGRKNLPSKYAKLARSIGKIVETTNGYRCTAFCVSPNTIVTNAHCVAWGTKRRYHRTRNLRNFVFRLGKRSSRLRWQNIKPLGNPYLSALVHHPKRPLSDSNYVDWAALRLTDDLCIGHELKLAEDSVFRRMQRDVWLPVLMVGYHRDRRRRRLSFQECPMGGVSHRYGNAIVGHTCDTGSWSSGSPMFVRTSQGLEVLAIHRGGTKFKKPIRLALGSNRVRKWRFLNIAVVPLQLKWTLPAFIEATFIDQRVRVRAIKERLNAQSYYNGPIDGKITKTFIQSIKSYELANKHVPIGILSPLKLRQLGVR